MSMRLRGKVEADPARPELIRTVWGVGYRLDLPPDPATGTAASTPATGTATGTDSDSGSGTPS